MSVKPSFLSKFIIILSLAVFALLFLLSSISGVSAQTDEDRLKAELEKVEQEIKQQEQILNQQKQQTTTIQGKVNQLGTEIKKAETVINLKKQVITKIGSDISLKEQNVAQLNAKLERSKKTLAELLRATDHYDDMSLPEIILSFDNLSDFFEAIDTLKTVQGSLDKLFDEIRQLRGLTEEEKLKLEARKQEEADAKKKVEEQKAQVAVKKGEQDGLLAVSKTTEKSYEQVLAEKRAKASAIRSALFKLRDSAGISFGEALTFANEASKATGVRPAFILAILKQESDLGKNVGTCNRPGDPEEKLWYNIMPGPTDGSWRDDQTNFKKITDALGISPEGTPLSCPMGNGWGGAMGPSQFIPTTWLSYASRVQSALGVKVANPWNPEHAFTATAFYMSDLGAGLQTYTAEKTAALKYYAGSNWSLPQNQFYGNQVLATADEFQKNIDFLKDVN